MWPLLWQKKNKIKIIKLQNIYIVMTKKLKFMRNWVWPNRTGVQVQVEMKDACSISMLWVMNLLSDENDNEEKIACKTFNITLSLIFLDIDPTKRRDYFYSWGIKVGGVTQHGYFELSCEDDRTT